jgi:hypothetical protein
MAVITATQEAEAGESQVQGQPGQHGDTLSYSPQTNKQTKPIKKKTQEEQNQEEKRVLINSVRGKEKDLTE